jgi:carboxymethylenebutenolidase
MMAGGQAGEQAMSEQAAHQDNLARLWEEHMRHEFDTKNTEETIATMVPDSYVNHIPVMTGGFGHTELRQFYSTHFIPKMPPDMGMTPISRTIGSDQLVDEMVISFTHSVEIDWMLPGIAPTGRHVEVALVVIVRFRDGKLAHEHIYWDQASVLAQLGLIDAARLPVGGADSAKKALNPSLPSNALIRRAG